MRFVTLVNELSLEDLHAIARGLSPKSVSDRDFHETLAVHKCFVVPPWVVRANPTGGLTRICQMQYDALGNIDKCRMLLRVAQILREAEGPESGFGGRFAI